MWPKVPAGSGPSSARIARARAPNARDGLEQVQRFAVLGEGRFNARVELLKAFLESVAVLQQAAQAPHGVAVQFRLQGQRQRLHLAAHVRCEGRQDLLRRPAGREPVQNGASVEAEDVG